MAGNSGRNSKSDQAYYNSYNYEANRQKRLERHLKNQPNDEVAQKALNNIHFRGPKPSNQVNGWVPKNSELYQGVFSKGRAKEIAWVSSIMRDSEKQYQHSQNYAPKSERQKGGVNSKNSK